MKSKIGGHRHQLTRATITRWRGVSLLFIAACATLLGCATPDQTSPTPQDDTTKQENPGESLCNRSTTAELWTEAVPAMTSEVWDACFGSGSLWKTNPGVALFVCPAYPVAPLIAALLVVAETPVFLGLDIAMGFEYPCRPEESD